MKNIIQKITFLFIAIALISGTMNCKAQALSVNISNNTGALCFGACNGSLTASASGGAGGYTFNWSPGGMTSSTITGLCAGAYTVTVTDALAATATAVATVGQPPLLSIIPASSPLTTCNGGNANLCVFATGGVNPYTYTWVGPNGFSSNLACPSILNVQALHSGTYTCYLTDANNCTAQCNVVLNVAPNPVATINSFIEPSCAGANGQISAIASNGNAPYTYNWNTGNTTPAVVAVPTGIYTVTITDMNGCIDVISFHLLDSCEVVWPGDADNDLTVNSNDILEVGLFYGSPTNARPAQGNNYNPYPSQNTGTTKANGFDIKHSDCNGDGLIDAADTTAVTLNYNLNHPPYRINQTQLSGPPLSLSFTQDSTGYNDKAICQISLGDAANPVNNVYGIALTIQIDTSMVARDSTSLDVSNSWIGTGSTPYLNNLFENYNQSLIEVVMCRTDHNNVSGFGPIGEVEMIMKDDISGGRLNTTFDTLLKVGIINYKLIRANGDTMTVSPSGDSIKVTMLTTGIVNYKSDLNANIYPNPANDYIVVESNEMIESVEIYDLQGKVQIQQNNIGNKKSLIYLKTLNEGLYFTRILTRNSSQTIKILKN